MSADSFGVDHHRQRPVLYRDIDFFAGESAERKVFSKMSVALDSSAAMETQAAQLNLLLYQMYRPYFNGKQHCITHKILGRRHSYKWAGKSLWGDSFLGHFLLCFLGARELSTTFFLSFSSREIPPEANFA